jgi:hypothetical protein
MKANAALFLVIQHAPPSKRVKYLPVLREAVANNNAFEFDLALLEDRVITHQCEEQIYGSQLGTDPVTKKHCLYAIKEPEKVDQRRIKIGLRPMQEYLNIWDMDWNPTDYPICGCKVSGN